MTLSDSRIICSLDLVSCYSEQMMRWLMVGTTQLTVCDRHCYRDRWSNADT
jgi:hypothetical protein